MVGDELRLLGLFDDGFEALQFFGGQLAVLSIHQSRHGIGEGAFKERVQDAGERGFAGLFPGNGGRKNIARTILAVFEDALFLQDAQQGADGGVAGGIRKTLDHFGGSGLSTGVDDVHDLPLPAAQFSTFLLHANFLAHGLAGRKRLMLVF